MTYPQPSRVDAVHPCHLGAVRTAFYATSRVLLLGEDNPQSERAEHALFPYPPGCAGQRLRDVVLGVTKTRYHSTWRTNLCCPTWSAPAARERFAELVTKPAPWDVVVMLGSKVRDVAEHFLVNVGQNHPSIAVVPLYGSRRVLRSFTVSTETLDWITLVSLPHPSGRCREWNDPDAVRKSRAVLMSVAPEMWDRAPLDRHPLAPEDGDLE